MTLPLAFLISSEVEIVLLPGTPLARYYYQQPNMAQNTAEAVKNTLGINHPSNTTTGTASADNITKGGFTI
ncbi:hypothetical protein H5410_062352 [Solanum commersonii]|uniref:Uncharacterized protein n=1 Tax=Solanum commersonii TaxID=4109 RepID=A0A9J5WAN0_SOLCO|nr:hypothetical protein H5410_062352 [Solanum commersonii]